jgi:hypothetical protein
VRKTNIIALLFLALTMAGCGSNTAGPGNINGNWSATLTDTNGATVYAFTTTFTEAGAGGLTVTNFTFTSTGPCFATYPTSETGTFTLSGNLNGSVMGTFGMTITTIFPAATNNVLTLQGTVNGSTISGTWTLTGLTGCSGNGTFTIHPPMAGG